MSVVDFDGNIINADALDAAVTASEDVAGLVVDVAAVESDLANTDANVAAVVSDLSNTDANVALMVPLSAFSSNGCILIANATGEVVALPIGAEGQHLIVSSGAPAWANVA